MGLFGKKNQEDQPSVVDNDGYPRKNDNEAVAQSIDSNEAVVEPLHRRLKSRHLQMIGSCTIGGQGGLRDVFDVTYMSNLE